MTDQLGLSQTTLIVVVVCGSLAGLIVLILASKLVRSSRRRRRRPVVPLPPVQPLAHRRTTKFESIYDTPLLHNHSRPPSTIPSSYSPNTPDAFDSPRLSVPIPTFNPSSDSFQSSDSNLPSPSSYTRHAPPSRPLSTVSVTSNGHSSVSRRTSRHTLRGVPHAPYSQVQIILPTPLAPSLQPLQSRQGSIRRDDTDRMSLVDKWVPVGSINTSTPRVSRRVESTTSSPTSPSSYSYFQYHSPPPPVPRLPSLYPVATPTESKGPTAHP